MRFSNRSTLGVLAAAALALFAQMPAAHAQDVTDTMTINWELPTETECLQPAPAPCVRLPLTGPNALTGIELYISPGAPIPDNSVMTPTSNIAASETTTNRSITVPNGSTVYVRLKAKNSAGAGPFSVQASKQILKTAKPGAPVNVTITLNIT